MTEKKGLGKREFSDGGLTETTVVVRREVKSKSTQELHASNSKHSSFKSHIVTEVHEPDRPESTQPVHQQYDLGQLA